MDKDGIIIVPKATKYELDMAKYHLTPNGLEGKYREEGVDPVAIRTSHDRQKMSLHELEWRFAPSQFVERNAFNADIAAKASLVIALGGDNHFTYVGQFLRRTPLLGINSDPISSEGALTYHTADNFSTIDKRLRTGEYATESWTRLDVAVNGNSLLSAICDIFLGAKGRQFMSRHHLEFEGKEFDQKGSGLIISTGAGSSGWYSSACRYLHSEGDVFSKEAREARFVLSEPYKGRLTGGVLEGKFSEGGEIIVTSQNNTDAIVSVDSYQEVEFRRGAVARIKISEMPLSVIRVNS